MLLYDFLERLGGDFAVVEVETVKELAGAHSVSGQPAAQGGHVVGASGVDTVLG